MAITLRLAHGACGMASIAIVIEVSSSLGPVRAIDVFLGVLSRV